MRSPPESVKRHNARRYWPKVERRDDEECWPWLAAINQGGYGTFGRWDGERFRTTLAHRTAWEFAYGEPPAHLSVCHRCDNPLCQNPAHLFLGTDADNTADKVTKGRQARGLTNGRTRLTELQVREIHRRLAGGETQVALAAEFDVTHHCIQHIARGRSWRDLGLPALPKNRLSADQVRDIRHRFNAGKSGRDLAAEFDLSPAAISLIVNHKRYASIT